MSCFASGKTKPEVSQACLLIAFEARNLHLRHLPRLPESSATNLTRHTSFGTGSPSSRELKAYRTRNKPHRFACSLVGHVIDNA